MNERARILDVTEDEYFADPCVVPSLSQSVAHVLVSRSPLHAWAAHPRLGKLPEPEKKKTAAIDEGSIIHSMLLGKGADIDVINADNYLTKAVKELRDSALEAGRIPILEWRYKEILAAAEALHKNLAAHGILFSGESEVALEWYEDGADGPVLCRGRPDHIIFETGTIYDVKKITAADPRTRSRHATDYGHDIQEAAYRSALTKLLPQFAGRVTFLDLYCEIEPPYAVVPAPTTASLRWLGESRWQRAVRLWERCLKTNEWPSYTVTPTDAPIYAITQEEEILNAANS